MDTPALQPMRSTRWRWLVAGLPDAHHAELLALASLAALSVSRPGELFPLLVKRAASTVAGDPQALMRVPDSAGRLKQGWATRGLQDFKR